MITGLARRQENRPFAMPDRLVNPLQEPTHLAAIGVEMCMVRLRGNRPGNQIERQRGLAGDMRQDPHQVQRLRMSRECLQDLPEDGLGLG